MIGSRARGAGRLEYCEQSNKEADLDAGSHHGSGGFEKKKRGELTFPALPELCQQQLRCRRNQEEAPRGEGRACGESDGRLRHLRAGDDRI